MKPCDCKTLDDVCKLKTDGTDTRDFWFNMDGYTVALYKQRSGEDPTEKITMPKKTFDKFVKWYQTNQPANE